MRKRRLLVVDDDDAVLDYLAAKLGARYELISTTSSEEVVRLAHHERPDLILCDIDMPGMDGGDVSAALFADDATREIPMLFLTGLVSGIIDDSQQLLKQQMALIRSEIKHDLKVTTDAAKYMGLGAGVTAVGGLVLVFALVYLLKWLFPDMHLAGCYAIVGGLFTAIGAGLIYGGLRLFKSNNPLPDQSVQALQENVQWLTNNPK